MSQSDFVTRGQALVSAGQFQEAVKVCRLGLLGRPTTVEGRVVLGQALLALKRFDEVLAEMRVALELDHGSVPAQALKGEALLRKGDHHAAVDVLQKVRALSPTDPRIAQLLAEAERAVGKPRQGAGHPSVSFVGDAFTAESQTKHYPHHADQEDTGKEGLEDTGGSYTRPTSLAAPEARRRSKEQQAMGPQLFPPPAADTGTVDLDPEEEGVELGGEDLEDIAAPPVAARGGKRAGPGRAQNPAPGAGMANRIPDRSAEVAARKAARARGEISSVELADDEIMELDETVPPADAPRPGAFTAVRNAVNRPSGPMPDPPANLPLPRTTAAGPGAPPQPHLAQLIANAPHVMQMQPVPAAPAPFNPRSALAAALPTQAAIPIPAGPGPLPSPASVAAAARQTVVAQPAGPPFPGPGGPAGPPQAMWAPPDARTVAPWGDPGGGPGRPGSDDAARQQVALDAHLAALSSEPSGSGVAIAYAEPSQTAGKPLKTGMRRTRSRFTVVLWVIVGAVMIGGGVFAGFQIRAMRLGKQIDVLREEAASLASTDTWVGWLGARQRLASVAQASSTVENRAALARTRAILAYEFGDGLPEAQADVGELAGQGGLHGELAAAFVALAQSDAKAARAAADRALALDGADPLALYASSQAALLGGDLKLAAEAGKSALEKEARAMFAAGLARVYAAATSWEEGLAATDQALKATPEHPGALIVRGVLLAEGGRIVSGAPAGTEIRGQLEKIVREGTKSVGEQPRGVSPAQVAYADLALARVDAARGNVDAAKADMANALAVGLDEQRFAEEVVETLYSINLLASCRSAAERALSLWPGSLRARVTLAQVALAQGQPEEALGVLDKAKDLAQLARGLAVRGAARLGKDEVDAARADFDEALKRAPRLEPAIIGRAAVDLRAKQADEARKRIEPLYRPGATSPALASAYAQILFAANEQAKAKGVLEKAAAAGALIDAARAQLDFARMLRAVGDSANARTAYEQAARAGSPEVRLEAALYEIEERYPAEGRDAIEKLLQDAGEGASAALLLEAARARMLVGDHPGAKAAFERLQKYPDVVRWQLERERGRFSLRRGDTGDAAQRLARALDGCGEDAETFLLAAEVASTDIKQAKLVAKLRTLTKERLKDRPEASIVAGKLALAEDRNQDAETAYEKAKAGLAKATARRQAQAELGRAVVAYNKRNDDVVASDALKLAIALDPTLYNAYLFYADLLRDQSPAEALELVKKAVTYNPDFVDGWVMYGTIAHRLRRRQELARAITRVNDLSPGSEALRQLQGLR